MLRLKVIFEQIKTQNLLFFRLRETYHRSLKYYPDYEFSVYFLKFLSFFLLAKFGPTIWNSPNRLYLA